MLFFIPTLPCILCASAVSHVSFFELFGPIAGAINHIYVITSSANTDALVEKGSTHGYSLQSTYSYMQHFL